MRLTQGRFDDATVYSDDPTSTARSFVEEGAEALHLVDLDGARFGEARNLDSIIEIRESVGVPIQVGGGIRTSSAATRLYEAGIDRIILGTAASESPALLRELLDSYDPRRVAAAIDVRDGRVAIEGWETESARALDDVIDDIKGQGVGWVVCTDVRRDGVLTGPSDSLARRMVSKGFEVIVAGGIARVQDVVRMRDVGAAGCIIGRALYTGSISLSEALEAARAD